jgi:Putative prokaryotic signal transducing protein
MIIVYRAANIADAHLIRQLLEAEGIPAFIQGEYLQGAVGELPANTEILLHVADENAEAARSIVDEWESAEPVVFDDDDSEKPTVTGNPSAPLPANRGVPVFWMIGSLVFGAMLGAGLTLGLLRTPQSSSEIDYDRDGRADEFAYYFGERIERVEMDRNRDGKIDQTLYYDANGFIARGESDDDFNGRIDSHARYKHGQIMDSDVDFDGDGRPEYRAEYRFDVILRDEFMGADGVLVKRIQYKNGWPHSDEFDSDGDGRLDTKRQYDRRGEIAASEPLPVK